MSTGLNKVRGRHGFINIESYKRGFKAKYPDTDVTYTQYIAVLKASNAKIRDIVLDNPLGFKLPYDLGYVTVDRYMPNGRSRKPIDWPATLKFGYRIPLLNLHSFGHIYMIKLFANTLVKPMLVYKFNAHRILKRMLAKRVKAGNSNYLKIERGYFTKRFSISKHLKDYY